MEQIDRINNIIQPFLDEKGNYDYLKPINLVERQFKVDRKFGFYPTGGSKEEYDAPPEFKDESERLEFIKILNTDIRAYNKWAGDRPQYPNIDEFPEYSFLVVRDGDPYVDKRLYIEIHDELLYEHIQDEDFVPRFNKTIYDFLKSKKEELESEDRWDNNNIWYTPYRNFGDWFDRHPSDVKPYTLGFPKEDVTDALWSVADDLREKVPSEFPTYRDAYKDWCENHTHKGKDISWESLENEYKKAGYKL